YPGGIGPSRIPWGPGRPAAEARGPTAGWARTARRPSGRPSGHRRAGWLIAAQTSDGKREDYWSNWGEQGTRERPVRQGHQRHGVERFHEEAKGLLGWDQYPGRRWQGFHRHAVSVMLADSFLVWREWQGRPERARPGRPRRAFSPSAGSAADIAAGGASAG